MKANCDRSIESRREIPAAINQQADYLAKSLKRIGAIEACDRIFQHGCTEQGLPLNDTPWFRDQLRLTADMRLKHVLTTGASQVSKTLGNMLVCVDCLVNGQLNTCYAFSSRNSMQNQQPQQFQPIANRWIASTGSESEVSRDAISRYSFGVATGYFVYANSSSAEKAGGASEGRELASFRADLIWEEERSSWRSDVDLSPRLGASLLRGKNRRSLGTPGAGAGIERQIKDAAHYFCPAVTCQKCSKLTFLEPKGALLKSKPDSKTGKPRWFSARGEILGFWSKDGSADTAYVACTHCGHEITSEAIAKSRLHCKKTGIRADEFLDALPEDEIFGESIAIYLSPLLRIPTDPTRAIELVKEGLNPENPSIYQQNKLGYASETDSSGVTIEEFYQALRLPEWRISSDCITTCGIDQGRDTHWIVVSRFDKADRTRRNILLADAVAHEDVLKVLAELEVDFGLIDSEPDRLSAYELCQQSGEAKNHPLATGPERLAYKLALADQRSFDSSYKPVKVSHGGIVLPCYAINNSLYKDSIAANFSAGMYRITGPTHRKLERHLTSIKRNPDTGVWERPIDHDDDLFFALLFDEAAAAIVQIQNSAPAQRLTGMKLQTVQLPGQSRQPQDYLSKRRR